MNYGKGSWPCWALDEITQEEVKKFLERTSEKQNTFQPYSWLLSLLPPSSQSLNEEENEWESDDSDAEKFPECLSSIALSTKDKSFVQQNNDKSLQVLPNDESMLLGAKEEQKSFSKTGDTREQQELILKSLLQSINEENCTKEKKLKELSVLEALDDSSLIIFIEKASVSIKCEEKKADFCLLVAEVLKDRTYVLGKYFYLPWFQNSGKNSLTILVTSLAQTINSFFEQACHEVLLPLLNSSQSGLVQDPAVVKDILALCNPECWWFLLRHFLVLLNKDKLAEWHLPALDFLCHETEELDVSSHTEPIVNELTNLLRVNSVDFSKNRYFGNIILLLINIVKKHQKIVNLDIITSQLTSIIQFHKGPTKYKASQMLKKLTAERL
ncbi:uncharacterized protein [Bemisia tabaci]|uniref:uncharacterized protein n=1 Tax=Bemisia tabaci TaxID=7038 RepID=UPI003B287E57